MKTVEELINDLLDREGGYVNDPSDPGGGTKYGWTKASLKEMGWAGEVKDLPRGVAFDLYYRKYWLKSRYKDLYDISPSLAEKMLDAAVNCGLGRAGSWLQRSLNALNNQESQYPDIKVDGIVGNRTLTCVNRLIVHRGVLGEVVLRRAINTLQGAHYITLCERSEKFERFAFGWLANRVD